MKLPELPDLPVRGALDRIVATLAEHETAVLVAPPGTGKTTLVPLALAAGAAGRVLVAEPRRLAARAAAGRMAALLGESVGETVGYSVRGDRRVGKATRVEVVTSGLLVRRLQGDPELAGVDVVVLDECHERHLDADLLLALLLDARAGLRPDLQVLATSATVAAERLSVLLGGDEAAPVVEVQGRAFPVELTYVPSLPRERIEAQVARATRTALAETEGDVLVFLPGAAEIRRTTTLLADLNGVDVVPLHGRLSAAGQDTALRPGSRRRVVLSTAVAESSLTVPGVRAVVDSGLARVPRIDRGRGLSGLATVRVSSAVAAQRAGRAGREAAGHVWRCWPEYEHSTLPAYPEPEIRTADLTRLALELACWGTADGHGLAWWDPPPPGGLAAGREVLRALGAVDGDGAVTDRGRAIARIGLHPRLARALLDGAPEVGARAAAEVVTVLDDDTLIAGVDLTAGLRALRRERPARWRKEVERLARLVEPSEGVDDPALVVALAYPERLARRRGPGSASYLMVGGTAVTLPHGSGLGDAEWLAVGVATRDPGRSDGWIRSAAVADEQLARRAASNLLTTVDEVAWTDGDVVARRVARLGAIMLSEKPIRNPDRELLSAAIHDGLNSTGLTLLRWNPDAIALRQRLEFLHRTLGEPWPAVDDDALLAAADNWLGPELATARKRADLERIDAGQALRRLLPWPDATRLDELAPERLEVPSGSHPRLDYSTDPPVLAVKVQEVFGWTDAPRLADGRIPIVLHLLSPAQRPVAVTADLASFWRTGWLQVRADLRGRYPKHAWPEDPTTVPAHRGTARNAGRGQRFGPNG